LPFRETCVVAAGLGRSCPAGWGWARLAVVRKAQQAAVAKRRRRIVNLSFW
jgi:hypothetical protein